MKILVIGPQLSGKTTLVRYLRQHTNLNASEIDEEILAANGGVWPSDNDYKDDVLIPEIYQKVAKQEHIIFFANYFYPLSQVEMFKDHGFTVVQLKLSYDEMLRRNHDRMEHEGYEDATPWLKGQLENHEEILAAGLIDKTIDATLPTAEITNQLLSTEPFDAVIVLGFDVTEDGITPEEGKSRVRRAVQMVRDGEADKIVLSGRVSRLHSYTPRLTEAESMKQYALSLGVGEDQIVTESLSENTFENATYCKKIVDTNGWRSLAIVTSGFHMARSKQLFEKVYGHNYTLCFYQCENRLSTEEAKLIDRMEQIKSAALTETHTHVVSREHSELQSLLRRYLELRATQGFKSILQIEF